MININKDTKLLEQLLVSLPQTSRSKIKQMLHNGRILVNGKVCTQFDHPLRAGDTVEVGAAYRRAPALNSRFLRIVYEDDYLVVIEKNTGILSMATSHHSLCVKTLLDNYFEHSHQRCRAHLVHRLDRDTSGLMLYAKSRDVQQRFEANWKELVYDRRYVAVVNGHFPDQSGTIQSWLKDNSQYFTYSSYTDNGGKWAVTHYRVLERGKDNDLVEARLDTGRKNQIRVHFADRGHSIVGDRKYVSDPRESSQNLAADNQRLCLHAYRLHFIHPVTGKDLHFDTPIPPLFLKIVRGRE